MNFTFFKYHGAGNDFILIDHRSPFLTKHLRKEQIALWCHRQFGVGADGFILLETHPRLDFKMVYYNADGAESSMCGNGGRCIAAFAYLLGIKKTSEMLVFEAIDGVHEAKLVHSHHHEAQIDLLMRDVSQVQFIPNGAILNTGSPHYVINQQPDSTAAFLKLAHQIRYNAPYAQQGINVNAIWRTSSAVHIRTYERGVENETLACGTGVVAAAITAHHLWNISSPITLKAVGGDLSVKFDTLDEETYTNIHLTGPATFVFKGELSCTN